MSPEFITSNETSITENIPLNTVVMAIKAIDKDEGRNGYIEYTLATEPFVPFTLGSVDGLLRISGRLDRELRASYKLKVTARDRGEPSRSTHTEIMVKVLDLNDNVPSFDPRQYSAAVAENASIGAMVLQVSKLTLNYNKITYSQFFMHKMLFSYSFHFFFLFCFSFGSLLLHIFFSAKSFQFFIKS